MRTDGLTDGQNEADSRFSQFCQRGENVITIIFVFLHIFNFLFDFNAL